MSIETKEYIDVDDALKRVGGNMALYQRLLGRFADGNQFEELENLLKSGNEEEATRMAHTIKGVAANLSLLKLRFTSAELELSLKEGTDYTAKLDELRDVYNTTMQVISENIAT